MYLYNTVHMLHVVLLTYVHTVSGVLPAGPQRGVEHLLSNATPDLYQGLRVANGHVLQVSAASVVPLV